MAKIEELNMENKALNMENKALTEKLVAAAPGDKDAINRQIEDNRRQIARNDAQIEDNRRLFARLDEEIREIKRARGEKSSGSMLLRVLVPWCCLA